MNHEHVPSPEQAQALSGARAAVALSRRFVPGESEDLALRYAQFGIPFVSEHSAYLTVRLREDADFGIPALGRLASELHAAAERDGFTWVAVLCVSPERWEAWCRAESMESNQELFRDADDLRRILRDHQPPYAHDGGDLFFQVQALEEGRARAAVEGVLDRLADVLDPSATTCTMGDSVHAGRIYGGRMLHGLISSVDPVGFSARAVIGDEIPGHKGGCFCLTQRFVHDWQQLLGMADSELESLIGRDHFGNILTDDDARAHVRLVRVNDEDGLNYRLVGQSQPFRTYTRLVATNGGGGSRFRLEDQPASGRLPGLGFGKELGVYQISYAKSLRAFTRVLAGMVGDQEGYIRCRHLNVSHADSGSFWYVPSATELGLGVPHPALTVLMNEFFDIRSDNGWMFYNTRDYLHRVGNRDVYATNDGNGAARTENLDPERGPDCLKFDPPLTDRVVELLGYTFSRWHDTWYRRRPAPELGHLRHYVDDDERGVLGASVAERKGMAVKKTLELLSSYERVPIHPPEEGPCRGLSGEGEHAPEDGTGEAGRLFDTFRLHPRELIVGVVPDYTLGSGFEAMRYLTEEEHQDAFVVRLSEEGAAGHNVPGYDRLLRLGVGGLIEDVRRRLAEAPPEDAEAGRFYRSVVTALEGVQQYMRNYAGLARAALERAPHGSARDRENLEAIATRMDKLASEPPGSFLEAAQLVFSMHCCMHIAGESVSLGRLDQLLAPFYQADDITAAEAQEVIDCFWIKMDEKVVLSHRHVNDRLSRGAIAITYESGDFPQGAAINQWVQQVTVGGYAANGAETPQDASNEVTRMCLRAARRLPLNAPCLSLRVHADTPPDIVAEAARLVLSGGGHPVFINDDKIVPALVSSGRGIAGSDSIVSVEDARDMVCDGCFEALMAGRHEFAFSYVPVPDAIEMALNRGRTYAAAGPVHVTGLKASFRSPPPEAIGSWTEFYDLFKRHYRYKLIDFYAGMLARYGRLSEVCPSPLLSPLIEGCLDSGRDMTAGGARYKMLAPLMNGISTAIDSLYAIKHMVFSDDAVLTLPELNRCLVCDWGYDMKEPFCSRTLGEDRTAVEAERFKHLRNYAVGLPKFGQGHGEVDRLGRAVVRDLVEMANDVIRHPTGPVARGLADVRRRFGTERRPFEFLVTPGVATFEDYAGVGAFLGASADGRRNGQAVASDCSPSPTPPDLPVPAVGRPARASLRAWAPDPGMEGDPARGDPIGLGLSNGSPVDINIRESFPLGELEELIADFARGTLGSNMLTISCADPATLAEAQRFPERYDLVRMRMGGWSEFFVAMFAHHQEHHKRRPLFEADGMVDVTMQTAWGGAVRGTSGRSDAPRSTAETKTRGD